MGSKSQWFLVNNALFDNLGRKSGPANDHTFRLMGKGVYLVLNGSVEDQGTKSLLITYWMQSSGEKCAIRLFYYMYGSDTQMGSLRIYGRTDSQTITKPPPILMRGNLGQQWFRAILAINSSEPFQFVIEGQMGAGNEADIAIDDISFSSGCIRAQSITSTTLNTSISSKQSTTLSTTSMSQTSQKRTTATKLSITTIQTNLNTLSRKTGETSLTSVISTSSKNKRTTSGILKSTPTPNKFGNKGKTENHGMGRKTNQF